MTNTAPFCTEYKILRMELDQAAIDACYCPSDESYLAYLGADNRLKTHKLQCKICAGNARIMEQLEADYIAQYLPWRHNAS